MIATSLDRGFCEAMIPVNLSAPLIFPLCKNRLVPCVSSHLKTSASSWSSSATSLDDFFSFCHVLKREQFNIFKNRLAYIKVLLFWCTDFKSREMTLAEKRDKWTDAGVFLPMIMAMALLLHWPRADKIWLITG